MNRREFLGTTTAALAARWTYPSLAQLSKAADGFPAPELENVPYIETQPIAGYEPAPASAYEAFLDMKFGVRIHWGIYSIWHRGAESWPFLEMSFAERREYNSLYKTWNPTGFDADAWMDTFRDSGMKMFAFTTKHQRLTIQCAPQRPQQLLSRVLQPHLAGSLPPS